MKNTQLRRLNKVLHNGVVKTIDCIAPSDVMFVEDRPNENDFGSWIDLDEVEFIELTEEILLKCGFTENKFSHIYEDDTRVSVYVNDNFFFCQIDNVVINHIKHLHQLQNIYFALTNTELEVKL